MDKFKIYTSKNISMKQFLDGPSAVIGEFKKKVVEAPPTKQPE